MKKKLNILFILVTLSLIGIITYQVYWSVNAYKVNKIKFDADIDVAMQKAMDDCKKDYFDSLRKVLVKRLSDTGTKITIDTVYQKETNSTAVPLAKPGLKLSVKVESKTDNLLISVSNKYASFGEPFTITIPQLNYYRDKLGKKAKVPEILAEMSFYIPEWMEKLKIVLGFEDLGSHPWDIKKVVTKNSKGIPVTKSDLVNFGIFALPANHRQADSLKLSRYFRSELVKQKITTGYHLYFSEDSIPAKKANMQYSETSAYTYKFHGFVYVNMAGPEYFTRASFFNPQYAILTQMLLPLCLSVLLIFFTIYCFYYIIQLVMHQKKLAELKDDFINNMTHELKTPIATITVAIEALQKFNALNDAEKTQRYLQTSRKELARLNDLVTRVLNVAAFESNDIALVKENIDIDEMVNDVISSEKARSAKEISVTYDNTDLPFIFADRLHFRNILVNLFDNAVKYNNEPVHISVNCFKRDHDAVFIIADNGIGIPSAHINQIFDKFHRVPTGNVHNVKGTGLGLNYVKYIVNAHGGNVTVKSEMNKGSVFTVSIPLSNE